MGPISGPLISVVIPSYNHERFVQATIQSILEQTYENIELLIVDDCSPDDTSKKILEYASLCKSRFRRFEFIQNDHNHGLCYNLNQMLKLCNGEFYCVVASDDIFHKKKVELQVADFCSHPSPEIAFSWTNGLYIDENSQFINENNSPRKLVEDSYGLETNTLTGAENYERIFAKGWHISTPSLMLRREATQSVGGYDESTTLEDIDICLKLLRRYNCRYLVQSLVYYRIHDGNFVTRHQETFKSDYVRILQREKEFCRTHNLSKAWKRNYIDFVTKKYSIRDFYIHIFDLWKGGIVLQYVIRRSILNARDLPGAIIRRIKAIRALRPALEYYRKMRKRIQ